MWKGDNTYEKTGLDFYWYSELACLWEIHQPGLEPNWLLQFSAKAEAKVLEGTRQSMLLTFLSLKDVV
jgi:hypothetical protein